MTVVMIETQSSLYLLDTDAREFSRRPIMNERTPAELRNTILAGGALDDDVWQPYESVRLMPHPNFVGPYNPGLRIDLPHLQWVQTTPVTDEALEIASRWLVEGGSR